MEYEPWQYKFLAVIASIAFCQGTYMVIRAFRATKLKRTIQNIPTSKIKTGAVGSNVEIEGFLNEKYISIVPAPLTGRPCALYKLEIQRMDSKVPMESIYSHDEFYLVTALCNETFNQIFRVPIKRFNICI